MYFFEDSIYYFVEKKNFERVAIICNFYFENFQYDEKYIKTILCVSKNNEESIFSHQACNDRDNNNFSSLSSNKCLKKTSNRRIEGK